MWRKKPISKPKKKYANWDISGKPLYKQLEMLLGECYVHELNMNQNGKVKATLSLIMLASERGWSIDYLHLKTLYNVLIYRGYVQKESQLLPTAFYERREVPDKVDPLIVMITELGISFYILGGFNEEKRKIDREEKMISASMLNTKYTKYLLIVTALTSGVAAVCAVLGLFKDSPSVASGIFFSLF